MFHCSRLSPSSSSFFFFKHPATPEIYTLSLHTLFRSPGARRTDRCPMGPGRCARGDAAKSLRSSSRRLLRSEEHTSELQSLRHLVCRLLLEKKNKKRSQKSNRDRHIPPAIDAHSRLQN